MPALSREDLDPDPIAQFRRWYAARRARGGAARGDRRWRRSTRTALPDARMVLLKGVGRPRAFASSPTASRSKAVQLEAAPGAALIALLARARPPGAGPGAGRAARRRGVRRLLREPPARLAARGLGVAAVDAARRPAPSSTGAWPRPRIGSTAARSSARRTGAATCCARWRSSSGRARSRGFTIASATAATARAGGSSASPPERGPAQPPTRSANSSSSSRSSKLELGADALRRPSAPGRRCRAPARARPRRARAPPPGPGGGRPSALGVASASLGAALGLAHRPAARRPRRGRAGGGRRCPSRAGSRGRGPR